LDSPYHHLQREDLGQVDMKLLSYEILEERVSVWYRRLFDKRVSMPVVRPIEILAE
jgi:hypothetical protein